MEKNIVEKHRINLEVMTETHVWDGNTLFRNIDILTSIAENRKIAYLIDIGKLTRIITGRNGYRDLMNALKQRNISMLIPKYKVNIEDVALTTYQLRTEPKQLGIEIKNHLSINNVPSIPGSELKGLLRTAILNYMIMHNLIDPKIIENTLNNLSFSERLKNIDAAIQNAIKKRINAKSTPLDLLRFIGISDPVKNKVNPVIDKVMALKLTNIEEIASEDIIGLSEGSTFEYELSIYKPVLKDHILGNYNVRSYDELYKLYNILIEENGVLKLLEILREFSLKLIDFEIGRIRGIKGKIDLSFIDNLYKWRNEVLQNNNIFYFRIGYGTGMYSKTVYLSLSPEQQKKLVQIMSSIIAAKTRGRINIWDTLTMKIVGSEYTLNNKLVPVGWVRLEIK
ncbi:type III-A CRISPR-associated RAMP protein Csm5 [Staphylothermus hellenicus]|uniref:CRISPR-associated RAMP protein, Csm5 family n=1 Tax=Staphylothermus hellenicus (strain DSM 12710 / JCM 10830 / BK20S6-10-b1 / P8) TaxID=591019 RepID=D7DBU0_STAHD|nr:type III-A CRISPR-associated RAMP protein Csm5 [Staphylothermus hellenicus]ADI31637.1 CRISPR-associated RAMP protein, Csm5 family [Staphylothermus hellenicus DSM 12710]